MGEGGGVVDICGYQCCLCSVDGVHMPASPGAALCCLDLVFMA